MVMNPMGRIRKKSPTKQIQVKSSILSISQLCFFFEKDYFGRATLCHTAAEKRWQFGEPYQRAWRSSAMFQVEIYYLYVTRSKASNDTIPTKNPLNN